MANKNINANEKSARLKQQRHEAHRRYYARTSNIYPAHPWTEEEIQMVMEHSIPDSVLSEQIGRSMKSIQEKRRRFRNWKEAGEPKRRPPKTIPEQSDSFYESVRLWKEGQMTCLEAAKRCGMPNSTFRYRAGVLCSENASQEKIAADQFQPEEYTVEQEAEEWNVSERPPVEQDVAEQMLVEQDAPERISDKQDAPE